MVHLLHRLYGVDAPEYFVDNYTKLRRRGDLRAGKRRRRQTTIGSRDYADLSATKRLLPELLQQSLSTFLLRHPSASASVCRSSYIYSTASQKCAKLGAP